MTDWALKSIALLHDPPEKVLNLAAHLSRAFALMEQVIGLEEFQRRFGRPATQLARHVFEASLEGQRVKQADRIASAIDRAAFPNQVRLESATFCQNVQVKHPFSSCSLILTIGDDAGARIQSQSQEIIKDYINVQPDQRKKYLALWRALPLLVPDAFTRLLPPDTRIVDHTLWAHLDASAALVSALPEVALLHVAVGPVQGFIWEARRTQDLWMGSYILSYLSWAGIKVVADQYGPDAVIYPYLRGQPLADQWLTQELGGLPPTVQLPAMTTATIPNKFVALVPASSVRGNTLPNQIIQTIRETWREIADAVHQGFPGGARSGDWARIWRRQIEREDWPEIYWSAVIWPDADNFPEFDGAQQALTLVESCLGAQDNYRQMLTTYKDSWQQGTNVGTMYGGLYKLLTVSLDARKRSRDFLAAEEDGEKCTVSPSLSALRPDGATTRENVRNYWQEVAQALRVQGRMHEINPDGSERLSAIVAVKRFAQYSYFQSKNITLTFPSTSRIAAATFYRDVFRKLPHSERLRNALHKYLRALNALDYPTLLLKAVEKSLPALDREVSGLTGEAKTLARALLCYEADVLYPERLNPETLKRDLRLDQPEAARQAQQACRAFRQEAGQEGITAPLTYYAILTVDGDKIGQWLSGSHPEMPKFRDAMHPDVLPMFQDLPESVRSGWDTLLNASRPLAANLHSSLSAALANFALRIAPFIIEQRHLGRVVYAGGDDLLALLPLTEVIPAACELYALFTGRACISNGQVLVDWQRESGFAEIKDEPLLMPGPRITVSAGIAIAHHLYPLDAALANARRAEEDAKNRYGRNALCIRALKRSGETLEVGTQWSTGRGEDLVDVAGLLKQLIEHFAQERLSSRFAYEVADQARIVTALSAQARSATLKRLVGRHKTNRLSDAEAEDLQKRLNAWMAALDDWAPTERQDGREIPQGFAELGRWLVLARFIAQGGGE